MGFRRRSLLFILLALPHASVVALRMSVTASSRQRSRIIRLTESAWRASADDHQARIRTLLQPGLLPAPDMRRRRNGSNDNHHNAIDASAWTALDPKNPTYNFLIEYYGLKGGKGPRRLARWSPDFTLLAINNDNDDLTTESRLASGILLEGATPDDLGSTLHLRGAIPHNDGIIYSPGLFYDSFEPHDAARAASAFLWYRSILQATLDAEPVLHCYGLHEWAMQYWPDDGIAEAPPSAKYQHHLQLRVSRDTINETVERKGLSCTHVDALRFFAPAAAPLNHHGHSLKRTDQVRLEQPACVHAHMDLLKIGLKLQPYVSGELLQRVLQVTLAARRLDVAASPYDVWDTYGISPVPVETAQGRAEYKRQQLQLMHEAKPIREELLRAYQVFLQLAFDGKVLQQASDSPMAERFAVASPGSESWRRNLVAE